MGNVVSCIGVPILMVACTCTFAIETVTCDITSNRSVPIRVNTGIVYVYNHTQTSCNLGMHNSVYISYLATAFIISVVVSITVIVIILMGTESKIKAAFELTNRAASMYTKLSRTLYPLSVQLLIHMTMLSMSTHKHQQLQCKIR